MSIDLSDTIVAIASPPGPARRGIVRISGSEVVDVVGQVFSATDGASWTSARRALRIAGAVKTEQLTAPLPTALMLWPTSRSYTGQPLAELHTIGSPPLLDAVVEAVLTAGARMAHRGEFTMRAFLSGKIDLVQAEAVLGVIDAADHKELETALTQLGGGVTSELADVRSQLLSLLGDLEAGLDFVEEDIEFISNREIRERLRDCHQVVQRLQEASNERLPSGYRPRIVLAGLPNAGKSTLFNALVDDGNALVSSTAGTTRDYLVGTLKLDSAEGIVIDTAGWEIADDAVMTEAQKLRRQQLLQSDLVIWCSAANVSGDALEDDEERWKEVSASAVDAIRIQTQRDLSSTTTDHRYDASVSAINGEGLDELLQNISQRLSSSSSSRAQLVGTTAVRCADSLNRAAAAIDAAAHAAEMKLGDEIIALEMRQALQQVGVILGETYTDDILGHIFSNFCIGK